MIDVVFFSIATRNSISGINIYWMHFSSLSASQVKKRVNKIIADLLAWSLKHCASGIAPTTGFYDEEFPKYTWRSEFAGGQLANGYRTDMVENILHVIHYSFILSIWF